MEWGASWLQNYVSLSMKLKLFVDFMNFCFDASNAAGHNFRETRRNNFFQELNIQPVMGSQLDDHGRWQFNCFLYLIKNLRNLFFKELLLPRKKFQCLEIKVKLKALLLVTTKADYETSGINSFAHDWLAQLTMTKLSLAEQV